MGRPEAVALRRPFALGARGVGVGEEGPNTASTPSSMLLFFLSVQPRGLQPLLRALPKDLSLSLPLKKIGASIPTHSVITLNGRT